MKIRCKICGDYFCPDDETMALMSDGYMDKSDVNTCDECWEMVRDSYDDTEGMISEADPGL
ncbi:MAG: hypothetical protein E4G94_02195 [ANME-2 cluster archaeon]|nr:MAG: hypothetical protein E4G94_02195 [ANME-2 cluster archaeon]